MDPLESGRYSFHRISAGFYKINATSDEHGVVSVGSIIRWDHIKGQDQPWEVWIDGELRALARTLKNAKRMAYEELDAPALVGGK